MAPPLLPFLPSSLPTQIQQKPNGRLQKPPVDLLKCSLREIVQYNCKLEKKAAAASGEEGASAGKGERGQEVIVCRPLTRLFRR